MQAQHDANDAQCKPNEGQSKLRASRVQGQCNNNARSMHAQRKSNNAEELIVCVCFFKIGTS